MIYLSLGAGVQSSALYVMTTLGLYGCPNNFVRKRTAMEKTPNSKDTILVVNDDPVQLHMLSKCLAKDGKKVITCMGGEEALGKLRELKAVDLIVTDLYMPGIDGWKLCRLLRSAEFHSFNQTPILVISATFRGSDAEEITRELGANAFLSVPYSPDELRCVTVLGHRQ